MFLKPRVNIFPAILDFGDTFLVHSEAHTNVSNSKLPSEMSLMLPKFIWRDTSTMNLSDLPLSVFRIYRIYHKYSYGFTGFTAVKFSDLPDLPQVLVWIYRIYRCCWTGFTTSTCSGFTGFTAVSFSDLPQVVFRIYRIYRTLPPSANSDLPDLPPFFSNYWQPRPSWPDRDPGSHQSDLKNLNDLEDLIFEMIFKISEISDLTSS